MGLGLDVIVKELAPALLVPGYIYHDLKKAGTMDVMEVSLGTKAKMAFLDGILKPLAVYGPIVGIGFGAYALIE